MDIDHYLKSAVERNASDLHLSTGLPPIIRVDGDLQVLASGDLSKEEVEALIY